MMHDIALIFVGALLGAMIACYACIEYWLKREKQPIEIKIDPAVLSQINGQIVTAWLDQRGLVWQPKGANFKPKAKL